VRAVEVRDKMPGKDVWPRVGMFEDGSVNHAPRRRHRMRPRRNPDSGPAAPGRRAMLPLVREVTRDGTSRGEIPVRPAPSYAFLRSWPIRLSTNSVERAVLKWCPFPGRPHSPKSPRQWRITVTLLSKF
jgi:hypothetical protein